MIPYDLDPSLHTAEPGPTTLDDGFSPPQPPAAGESEKAPEAQDAVLDPSLWAKSPF
jgi:hypothetical protein